MDSDESYVINERTDIAVYYMFLLFFQSTFYGMCIVIYFLALSHLWNRFQSSKAVKALFFLIASQSIMYTLINVMTILSYVSQFRAYHIDSTSIPIDEQDASSTVSNRASVVTELISIFFSPVANVVVIWRVWILYPHDIWIKLVLLFSWICEFGVVVARAGTQVFEYLDSDADWESLNPTINRLNGAQAFLTLGVNLTSTLLIAWKAWQHNLHIQVLESMKRNSKVLAVLYTLIEWGIILCVAQLIHGIMTEITVAGDPASGAFIASSVVNSFLVAVTGIHPAIIVLVLSKGQSVIENETMVALPDHLAQVSRPSMVGRISTIRFRRSIRPEGERSGNTSSDDEDAFSVQSQAEKSIGKVDPEATS